ncbi:unnamed protein product [Arabidopsis halleri]
MIATSAHSGHLSETLANPTASSNDIFRRNPNAIDSDFRFSSPTRIFASSCDIIRRRELLSGHQNPRQTLQYFCHHSTRNLGSTSSFGWEGLSTIYLHIVDPTFCDPQGFNKRVPFCFFKKKKEL